MSDLHVHTTKPSNHHPSSLTRSAASRDQSATKRAHIESHIPPQIDSMPGVRALQPRLVVGPADDPFEREAERMADVVTAPASMTNNLIGNRPLAASLHPVANRAPAKGEAPPKNDDDEPREEVRKSATDRDGATDVPRHIESEINENSAGGDPLPDSLRATFEPRFGYDFAGVRVHTDGRSAAMASALHARAFTVGDHIFFGSGQFQPTSPSGRHLIAHELTHTIQQKPSSNRVAGVLNAPVQAQRFLGDVADDILETVRSYATDDFPPWELLTVLLGRDPITDRPVERTARNWLHAVLQLVPNGMEIFEELESSQKIETVTTWFDAEITRLDLTWEGIKALFSRAWDSLDVLDLLSPLDAWNDVKAIFGPTIERLWNFIRAVGGKILDFIKTTVLEKISAWAQETPGYTLLTFVLAKDPVTDEVVERTPTLFVKAVLELVPGGDRIFENLEKTRTIEKTFAWLEAEIVKLDLTWETIKELFQRAWDAFSITDLLAPLELIERIAVIFMPPLRRLLAFVIAVGRKVLEFIFEGALALAGPIGQRIMGIFRRIGDTFNQIVEDPVGFVGNLVRAIKLGFQRFGKNIWEHLRAGIIGWLMGALEGAGLVLPTVWDLQGILSLVLQVLGITYTRIREKLVRVLGERTVSMLETAFEFLRILVVEGPAAAWEKILETLGSLWDMVIGGIQEWAVTRIVTAAITRIATMLNPAGAIIQAIIAIYNTIAFFIERITQIVDLVEAVVDSIANIAAGKLSQAAAFVERAMARTIPVIIGFLARLIGLGGISDAIKNVITAIQVRVDRAIDAVIDWIVRRARSLFGGQTDEQEEGDPRWNAAVAGVRGEIDQMERGGTPSISTIELAIPEWRTRYGFTGLRVESSGAEWIIKGSMSPEREVDQGNEEMPESLGDVYEGARFFFEEVAIEKDRIGKVAGPPVKGPDGRTWMIPYFVDQRKYGRHGAIRHMVPAFKDAAHTVKAYRLAGAPGSINPRLTHSASGNMAGSVSALPIWTTSYLAPADSPRGWDRLDHSAWVRAHLVHGEMGGPGTAWNLVPTPQRANQAMYQGHERSLVNSLRQLDPADGISYWMNVDVSWRTDGESTPDVRRASDFAREITVESGPAYLNTNQQWERAPGPPVRGSYTIRLPFASELTDSKSRVGS